MTNVKFHTVVVKFSLLKATLPKFAAHKGLAHFQDSFRRGGFTDRTFIPWAPRKRERKRGRGRAILVDKGTLRRDMRDATTANTARVRTSQQTAKYATVHNEGEGNMTQRKFMGDSEVIFQQLKKHFGDQIDKIWRNA